MITKEDLKEHLVELLKSVKHSDLQSISQKISEYLKFAVENYDNLSEEAKKITDDMLEAMQRHMGEIVANLPDSKEKRKLKRLHAASLGKHHEIMQYVKILESSPELKDESSKEFRKLFLNRLQNIIDFIFDIYQNTLSGIDIFAQFSLLCMCIDELLVTFHLVQHYYINQSYSHLRTVFEHLDKVELFRTNPQWAGVWCSNDDKTIRRELSPSEVRKKLGMPKYDPIYSFFSTLGTHSTFKAVQTKFAKSVKSSSKGNPEINIWLGGCPFEHNVVWLNTFAIYTADKVMLQIMTSFGEFLNEKECEEVSKQILEESIAYMKRHFLSWAKNNNLDTKEMEAFLNKEIWETIRWTEGSQAKPNGFR